MSLVNLKRSKEEVKKEMEGDYPVSDDMNSYPYGTMMSLDSGTVDKLGVQDSEAGEEVEVKAKAFVSSVDTSGKKGKPSKTRVSLQITDMEISKSSSDKEKAEKLYKT